MRRKSILGITLLLMATAAYAAQPVFDGSNYARALEMLKEAKKQVQQGMELKQKMDETNSRIGNLKYEAKDLERQLKDWRTYYDKIDSLDAGGFSALSWLGITPQSTTQPPTETFKLLNDKLFSMRQTASREEHSEALQQMLYDREKIARNSIVTSIVVAEKNKSDLTSSKRKIVNATNKSLASQDLSSLLQAQNDMLAIIATEMIMQRELQAQMLEFMSAHASNQYGTGRNEAPRKTPFKSSFK